MTIKSCINIDSDRNIDNLFKINLFIDGIWFRLYEMSAYLCNHIDSGLEESEKPKVLKRKIKDCGEYVCVGIPIKSIKKYLPNFDIDKDGNKINDRHIVIDAKDFFIDEDLSSLTEKFNEWKNNIELKSKSDNKIINNNDGCGLKEVNKENRENTLFGIAQKILSYSILDSTPNDNTKFIESLKNDVISLIC